MAKYGKEKSSPSRTHRQTTKSPPRETTTTWMGRQQRHPYEQWGATRRMARAILMGLKVIPRYITRRSSTRFKGRYKPRGKVARPINTRWHKGRV